MDSISSNLINANRATSPAMTNSLTPLLAASLRAIRYGTPIDDMNALFTAPEDNVLLQPPAELTDSERRTLLDLPDSDGESVSIGKITDRSREGLITRAAFTPDDLTDDEVDLLRNNFWTHITPQESGHMVNGLLALSQEARDTVDRVRQLAYLPNEQMASLNAMQQFGKRLGMKDEEGRRQEADAAMPNAKAWMRQLYEVKKAKPWGFVILVDAAAQKTEPSRLDLFWRTLEPIIRTTMMATGAQKVIGDTWRLQQRRTSDLVFAPDGHHSLNYDSIGLRREFHALLIESTGITPGLLTNTFLVVSPTCIESVLHGSRTFDDMRILAFDADFPVAGYKYPQGYDGFMWVATAANLL